MGESAMRMLVVDDEVDIANMLAEYFRMEGYDVTCANSGAEALAAASAGAAPDIMLLDVNMPGMDGFEVCRRVREHLSCPIIFLTARVEDVDQLDGFAAGADDYVMKPFSLEVLGRRVAAHMAREGRVRERENAVRFFRELTIDYKQRTVEVRPVTGEPGDGAVEGVGVEKPGSEGSHAKISDALEGSIAGGAGACPSRTYIDFTKLEFDIVALLSKRPGRCSTAMLFTNACGVGTPRATRRRCASMCAAFVTSLPPPAWPMIPSRRCGAWATSGWPSDQGR